MQKNFTTSGTGAIYWSYILFFLCISALSPVQAQSALPGSGNCLQLDGINDHLLAGQSNRGVTNKLTVEAWIKTSSNALSWIAGKYSNSNGEDAGYELLLSNGYAVLYGREGSNIYRSSGLSTTRVSDNRWHHIAGVFDNGRWEIWVDGMLENRLETNYTQGSLATQVPYLSIGFYQEFNNLFFQGNIDEVRIWNTVRTRQEIRQNMCLKLSGKEPNLVGYFTFDTANNNEFPDYSLSQLSAQVINTNTSQALTTSGAPLGNESREFYLSDWSQVLLEIAGSTGQETFQVFNPSANTKGLHLYRVDGVPNSRSGINSGDSPAYYYGVFTVGSAQALTYTVNYKAFQTNTCYLLYGRPDNAVMNWMLLPTANAPGSATLNKPGESGRGEYILVTNSLPPLQVAGPASICPGNTAVLTASGGGAGTYRWNNGATTPSITIDKPGVYTVQFTLPGGCMTEVSRTVATGTVPPFSLGPDQSLCAGATLALQAPAGSGLAYKWQDGTTGKALTVNASGWYWLEVSQNGCSLRDSVYISYTVMPVINLGADTTMCLGKTLLLQAGNPGMNYRWQDGSTAPTHTVSTAGIYWVDVENALGCITRDSIRVAYLTPPVVFLGADTTLCAGQSLTLDNFLPGVKYLWQDGTTQSSYTITRPGKYWVRASLDVCSESDTILVAYQPLPPVVFSGDTAMCRGSSVLLSAAVPGATYRWQDGSTGATLLATQEGDYWVEVRQGLCSTTSSRRIRYSDCEPFIPNIITPNADALNETFFIRNIDIREWSLEIYNRWGQKVYGVSQYGNDWAARDVADGVYYYKLSNVRQGRAYKGYVEVVR